MNKTSSLLASLVIATTMTLGCYQPGERSEDSLDQDHSDTPGPNDKGWGNVPSALPTVGLFDDKYFDGHPQNGDATPILPPGKWDWDAANNDLANWKNFQKNIGALNLLKNGQGNPYGWELSPNAPTGVDYSGSSAYFEGSAGADVVNLGPQGKLHSFTGGLRGGPDVLVFNEAWSVDFSMSSSADDPTTDQDVVVAGCDTNGDSSFDISAASIHTGAGSDVMFVRDAERAAFDAGNLDGLTSELDPEDGDDVVVYRGNMRDFRFYGGTGDDTAVWYVDEVNQDSPWLGPNFFGGGGADDAIWGDSGVDRLVLVIPPNTKMITQGPTKPGELLVRILPSYKNTVQWDGPTVNDPTARYCVTCGVSPTGRKTVTLEYVSANGKIKTGYFWVTAFEELQIGVGPQAKVYALDDVAGTATLDAGLTPFNPPSLDPKYCQMQP